MSDAIYKIGRFLNPAKPSAADEVRHNYRNTYILDKSNVGPHLRIGAAGDPVAIVQTLSSLLSEPLFVLLVLHTSRCDSVLGRYQSPHLPQLELQTFLSLFGPFLRGDARHDTWVHSPAENVTLVLDRHNFIYAHGHTSAFAESLRQMGFREGPIEFPVPHTHNYHREFDDAEKQILSWFKWSRTPLREEDKQLNNI